MNIAVRLIGAVPLATVAVVVVVLVSLHGVPKHRGPLLPMQRVGTVPEFAALVGDIGDQRRAKERRGLFADFGFIAFYLGLFVALAVLLAHRDAPWATWLAVAASITGAGAALCDVLENLATLRALRTTLANTTPQMIHSMRIATSAKFTLIAITVVLLSGLFWGDRPAVVRALGVVCVAVSCFGLIAVLRTAHLPAYFVLNGLTLAAVCVLFSVSPSTFLSGY